MMMSNLLNAGGILVAFSKKIKNVHWLSIPIKSNNKSGRLPINETEIAWDAKWLQKTLKKFRFKYKNQLDTEFGEKLITQIFCTQTTNLSVYNTQIIKLISDHLDLKTKFVLASSLKMKKMEKQERILNICKAFEATSYICGSGSRFYIDSSFFQKNDISVEWVAYNYPNYVIHQDGSKVYTTILDALFLNGINYTKDLLKQ